MHNSAFYLPLAALTHSLTQSTFPTMSQHNESFRNQPAQTAQDSHNPLCQHTHDSSQSDKEDRKEASHDESTVTRLKITRALALTWSCTYINARASFTVEAVMLK